jgi:hypothetical protein
MTRPMLDFDYCGHGVFWANSGNMSFMIEGQVMDGSPYECTTYLNKRVKTIFQGLGEAMGCERAGTRPHQLRIVTALKVRAGLITIDEARATARECQIVEDQWKAEEERRRKAVQEREEAERAEQARREQRRHMTPEQRNAQVIAEAIALLNRETLEALPASRLPRA